MQAQFQFEVGRCGKIGSFEALNVCNIKHVSEILLCSCLMSDTFGALDNILSLFEAAESREPPSSLRRFEEFF